MAVPLGLDSPLKQSIFAAYVFLWVASALLVYASKQSGAPPYNATSVVVLTELAKVGLALALYRYYDGTWLQLGRGTVAAWRLLLKYTVPAGLYAVYNNLMYINLTNFDPGTYTLMMQLRILFTGLLYQALFARTLNRNQWVALVLIAFGCIAKEAPKFYADTGAKLQADVAAWLLLAAQMLCSICAGLYNELLLKSGQDATGQKVSTNLQNAFMYTASILWLLLYLGVQGKLRDAVSAENLQGVARPVVVCIILIMSSVGTVTGFFLKYLDSVVLATVLSWALFGTPLDAFTVLAALMVGLGVALYSRPVAAGGGGGGAGSGAGSGAGEPEYKPVPSDDRATDGAAADDAEAPKRQV